MRTALGASRISSLALRLDDRKKLSEVTRTGTGGSLRRAVTSIVVLATGVLGWAAYAPGEICSDPACARERFRIFVEVDSFRDIESVALEVSDGGRIVTPASILELGGIRVQISHDQKDLPYAAASGPLTAADLRQYTEVWRGQRLPADANAGLYAMLTPALVSETGERLFGVMFDMAGREGFAVAPGETARLFKDRSEEWIALLQLRTFTHELSHALNRQHLDAAQIDGRLTIEAPTLCISALEDGRWAVKEAPFMSISPTTIRFFQTAAARDVLPGAANSRYQQLRTSATECDDARRNVFPPPALSRWELMRRRLSGISFFQAAHAQEGPVAPLDEHVARVEIRVQAQDAPYPLGYPIAVRLMVMNSGAEALPLRARLAPAYGIMQVERRAEGEADWLPFKPVVLYEPESDLEALLASGERAEETVSIFFGTEGWTFPRPGAYEVRARLLVSEDQADATSSVVRVRIAAPNTEDDQAVLKSLLDERGQLDDNVGHLLAVGGRIGFETDISSIAAISKSHGHTALGSSLRLILASQRLNPPIDPRTGVRPKPESGAARELLRETCSDSGVAALARELLERFSDAAPSGKTSVASDNTSAWDGVPNGRAPFGTYSDSMLQRFGPTLHFCSGDLTLTGSTRQGAIQLAKTLLRVQPQRIILIGHSDRAGSCERNDALALSRAEALKRVLIDTGIATNRIQTVSLGARRPLDFSASAGAHLLNRRVEVLIEGGKVEGDPAASRILPRCRG
jgi:outer membrane protein OmpA-like peptidoglycan-associated protein